jgi:hypothetical protein
MRETPEQLRIWATICRDLADHPLCDASRGSLIEQSQAFELRAAETEVVDGELVMPPAAPGGGRH